MARAAACKVDQVAYGHSNYTRRRQQLADEFKKKFNDDFYTLAIYNA